MKTIIVDSSVVAKWFFPSEENSQAAFQIQKDFIEGKLHICVPTLIYYELNNILKTAITTLRIEKTLANQAYKGFLSLDLVSYSTSELLVSTLEAAVEFNISSYDASYLALAEYLGIDFYTADEKLLNKVKNKFAKNLMSYH